MVFYCELFIKGGGIVSIDAKEKVLKTYGKSGGFGAVTINIVEKCLRETIAHQGYTFTVSVTNEIRG